MSAPSTSGLSVELLLRVIDVKYGYFTLLYFIFGAHLSLTESTFLEPKSLWQFRQRQSLPQAIPWEKQGHFVYRCPILSLQDNLVPRAFLLGGEKPWERG